MITVARLKYMTGMIPAYPPSISLPYPTTDILTSSLQSSGQLCVHKPLKHYNARVSNPVFCKGTMICPAYVAKANISPALGVAR